MNDTRFDKRPRLNYNFSAGAPLEGEQRVSAGFKNKRASRGSSEPRGVPRINNACSPSGKMGQELPQRRRDKADAERLLALALSSMG